MAKTNADVLKKVGELEPKLKGKLFLGGDKPSAEDVKAFNDLLGDKNQNIHRWVKHMASFTESERSAWGAAGKKLGTAEPAKAAAAPAAAPAAAKKEEKKATPQAAPKAAPKPAADSDSDDLFGEETEEEIAAREAKKKADAEARAAKNANKKVVIAKSSILADIKVWESETDLEALAAKIKAQEVDGLLWGAHKLTPVAFGVKKLTIMFTIEDEKVSSEDIEDLLANNFEEEVQSMDIVAWNKI